MKKIVHVGQMKSGTTYIQNSLSQNRALLGEAGFLYPGEYFNQQHACYGLCGSDIPWVKSKQQWSRLSTDMLKEIGESDQNILISSEALSCMAEAGVERFVAALNGIDEVVITVRNFHSVLLSAWQQSIKGGGIKSLPDFISAMRKNRDNARGMWLNYSFGQTTRLWSRFANVKIVIAERVDGKDALLPRFSSACGLPSIPAPQLTSMQENKSLRREDAELLRRFNLINRSMAKKERENYVRWLLRQGMFPAAGLSGGSKIKLPRESVEEITSWALAEVSKVPTATEIFGDLSSICEAAANDVEDAGLSEDYDLVERSNFILKLIFDSRNQLEGIDSVAEG